MRRELGVRTAFNLLGPLTNPAGATRQLVGVPRPEFTELMARALMLLGTKRAWVVHGADGIDELTTTGYTKISECRDGAVNTFYLHPADVGLPKAPAGSLQGGDAHENARIIEAHPRRRARAGARRRAAERRRGAVHRRRGVVGRRRDPEGVARDRSRRREADARAARVDLDGGRVRGGASAHDGAVSGGRADLLETIVAATRRIVEVRSRREPLAALAERAAAPRRRGPGASGGAAPAPTAVNVIAECKRRSPSRGVLRADYDPAAIARGYEAPARRRSRC